jgi:hypothetical protein
MKNQYKLVLVALFLLFIPNLVLGVINPHNSYNQQNSQFYSVFFDGEGEGLVNLQIDIRPVSESIHSYLLEIPYSEVRIMSVYEKVLGSHSKCVEWENTCVTRGTGSTCVEYDYGGNCVKEEAPCLKYENTCKRYESSSMSYEYKKLDVEPQKLSDKTLLEIDFEQPAKTGDYKQIFVTLKIYDSTDKSFGKFNSEFETFGTKNDLNLVSVGINVPQDFILKEGDSNVNYNSDFFAFSQNLETSHKVLNDEMEIYSRHIRRNNQYTKSARYLDPYETFTVNTTYSKSWFALYWPNLLLGIFIGLIIIAGIIFAITKLKQYFDKINISAENKTPNMKTALISFLGGLFLSLGIVFLWLIILFLGKFMHGILARDLVYIFYLIIGFLGVIITLGSWIGIPIYISNKFKASTGFFLSLWSFAWMLVFVFITFIFMGLFL